MAQKALKRDAFGRLLPGSGPIPGAGRKPGARGEFAENFIQDFNEVWLEHGPRALLKMAKEDPVQFVKAAVGLMPRNVTVDLAQLKCVELNFLGYDGERLEDIDGEAIVIYPDSRPTPNHDDEPLGLLHSVPGEAEVHELHPKVIPSYASYNAAGELVGVFTEDSMPAPLSETPRLRSSSGQPAPKTRHRIRATTDQRSVEDPLISSAEAAPGAAPGAFDLENYLDGL